MTNDVIEIQGLQKVVNGNLALDIEALSVGSGEIVALVGPVGSGKAQLLDLLIGRARPTVGSVRVARIDPFADREGFSRRVGVLFAEDSLYKQRSPLANLAFHCRLRGLSRSRAVQALARVGLADHADAKLAKLSPGLARRLALGQAILHEPAVLLMMEPFARCDEASISLMRGLMRELADDGATLLILTDTVANLTGLCDTVYMLEQGRIAGVHELEEEQHTALPFKIPARREGKVAVVLVNPTEIMYAEAEGGRAFLQTVDDRLATQFTLAELEERLARSGFFRAHRGYLVNLQHVREVIPYTRNSYSLRLDDDDGTEIPLSKSAAAELRDLLGY
jgi:ABC-2 type transport system ATP-binding protein